jgi:uncharacterized protein (DUF1800 family)
MGWVHIIRFTPYFPGRNQFFAVFSLLIFSAISPHLYGAPLLCAISVSGSASAGLPIDGVLLSRYAQGARGTTLTSSVLPSGSNAAAVESAIKNALPQFDVDGDGAFTDNDALILSRYIAGFRKDVWSGGLDLHINARRATADALSAYLAAGCPQPVVAAFPANDAEAARFLAQATFGPTTADIARVRAIGYSAWIDEQFAKPATKLQPFMDRVGRETDPYKERLLWSWWRSANSGSDQLRQRAAFALSQIFVISAQNMAINGYRNSGPADFYDTLLDGTVRNFRTLLENVSLHPMMGLYLSHFGNKQEDPVTGVRPDENYAREVMQLFSIGLYELNPDGTQKLAAGKPIPTYGQSDIEGLAKVFTGWGWGGLLNDYFWDKDNAGFVFPELNLTIQPMQPKLDNHSTSEKRFLGVVVPAQPTTAPNPRASLKAAMDRLASHPNVGPFIGRQLIQHMVTSNPSPMYIGRVAAAFNASNGDIKATVKAILLDPEARNADFAATPGYGRLREPLLRLTHFTRSLGLTSESGYYPVGYLITPGDPDAGVVISQDPFFAPSVFNYYRPGYVPPNTTIATAKLVAPQFQIYNEVSNGSWIRAIEIAAEQGYGSECCNLFYNRDITSAYTPEVALANNPDALIDRLNVLLMSGQISAALRADVREGINTIAIPATNSADAKRKRVQIAVLLMMSSPEYLVQK